MSDIDEEVQKIEKGETWEETDEVVEIQVKRPLDKVIPVRLSSDKWEELRREARELGIGPTTLARMWILERLRQVVLTRKSA
jgi:2-iminoacetate synthase ThiH